jgi:hypothetical protein
MLRGRYRLPELLLAVWKGLCRHLRLPGQRHEYGVGQECCQAEEVAACEESQVSA